MGERGRKAVTICSLIILALLAYWNSFYREFQYDDIRLIHFNFSLRDLANEKAIVVYERFRPLTLLSFALNFFIGKKETFSYHAVNLSLHVSSGILFFLLLSRQSKSRLLPAAAAAFMIVHPLNTESVTYIASRSILLCSIFYFCSLLAFDSYLRGGQWPKAAIAFFCFVLALLSKEEGAMIPVILFLYELFFFGRSSVRKHRVFYLANLCILIFLFSLRLKYLSAPVALSLYFPTEIKVWFRYLWLAIFPVSLSVDPDVSAISFHDWQFWVAAAVVVGVFLSLWRLRSKHPFVSFWGIWFFLNLLVSSSVFPLNEFMSEHRSYLSMFGFCALLAFPLEIFGKERDPSMLLKAAFLCILIFYIPVTISRNHVWRSHVSLWEDAARKSPHKARSRLNYAAALLDANNFPEAIREFLYTRSLIPDSAYVYNGLGMCYLRTGRLEEAERNFGKALWLDPNLTDAKTGMGMVLYQKGKYSEALNYLTEVYPERRESVLLISVICDSYLRLGSSQQATKWLKRGFQLAPADPHWKQISSRINQAK